ncbi:cadmium resistance transporter [Lacticaseibacillus porcinae]|uniref:cadmium resistance transporter n=1 Tax=Lacticaseibacillus porcinae TaxID=1123687 RepID=UPI000F7852DA|nr:cadmium resistance transporter [Lacticaseibacillus porcinae]
MNYWVLALTFLSVNLDFFFILLFLLKEYRFNQVLLGYWLGILILMTSSFLVGKTLATFLPEWALGILGILPIYMALHDDDDNGMQKHSVHAPVVTVLITYLSVCAGCNLAIFLPVLAGESWVQFGITLGFISILTIIVVWLIREIAEIPAVTRVVNRFGEPLMKVCYVLIGCYVFWDSGLIHQLISWI